MCDARRPSSTLSYHANWLLCATPQALLKLVRDAMKAGDSQHAVLLLRLLKGASGTLSC